MGNSYIQHSTVCRESKTALLLNVKQISVFSQFPKMVILYIGIKISGRLMRSADKPRPLPS